MREALEPEVIPPFDENAFARVVTTEAAAIVDAARERLKAHRKGYELALAGKDRPAVSGDTSRLRVDASRQPLPHVDKLAAIHALVSRYYASVRKDA